ncbi:MAG TPA: TIR domain-containing protein [Methanocella sp.]|uniref:TIR domain-containing protein n=1 Tax=Methanocella sp. TaxID=2052833 RepID=UPI002CA7D024|nr:TIR domain-containing protein [Methanocella sp.]HTY92070.1 TIR domain-containing protein [Methanocella sp.]
MVAHSSSDSHLRIFISYGHDEHANFAVKLKEDLLARGHELWFDLDKLKPGMEWERYIEDGLDWASRDGNGRVILIMTPHSVRRPDGFCLNELAMALRKKIKIIPVMLAPCEPPLSICRIQRLDMQDCLPLEERRERYAVKFHMLVEALEHDLRDYEGYETILFNILKPLSFDAEIRYNVDKFTGRQWVFEEIDRWLKIENASRIFWIVGGPGVGKTAISSWLCSHRPEIAALHFCRYDNVEKRDPRRAVMSIAYQLSMQLPDYEERLRRVNMDDLQGLDARTLFDKLIMQPFYANYPSPGRKIVILIDALDEATVDGKNEFANMIATAFERTPGWLRLIVTSRPNPEVMAPLQTYKPFIIDISNPLNNEDIKAYLIRELGQANNTIRLQDVEAIVEKSSGLFLYAEWIAAEIGRGHLSLDRPEEFPHNLGGIYLKLFERQIPDMQEWENTIAPALDVISAALEPLSIDVLASIFKWNIRDKRKFQRELGALFTFDNGIQPFHKSVMDWLTDETKQDSYYVDVNDGNKLLIEHLWEEYKNNRWSQYLISYLPIHLFKAQRWKDLETLLLDLKFIRFASNADKMRLLTQLVAINENSPLKVAKLYGDYLPLEGKDDEDLHAIADLLILGLFFTEGERILSYLLPRYRQSKDHPKLVEALGNMCKSVYWEHDFEKKMVYIQELEDISRKTNDKKALINVLIEKGRIYFLTDSVDRRVRVAKELEQVSRDLGDDYGLVNSLNILATAEISVGNRDRAILLLKEAEQIERARGYIDMLPDNFYYTGQAYYFNGDYIPSIAKMEEGIRISQQIGNKYFKGLMLEYIGLDYEAMGRLDDALLKYDEGAKYTSDRKENFGLSLNLTYKARVLFKKNRIDEAEALVRKALEIAMESGIPTAIQHSLGVLVIILIAKEDSEGAREALDRREKICREMGSPYWINDCLEQRKLLLNDTVCAHTPSN